MKKYSDADGIPDSEIPENFDWRNIKGINFMNGHRHQGSCGSCAEVSFVQLIEQRLKLKYGQAVPELSSQMLVDCNYMNEGCKGGYSLFNGYLAESGYLV